MFVHPRLDELRPIGSSRHVIGGWSNRGDAQFAGGAGEEENKNKNKTPHHNQQETSAKRIGERIDNPARTLHTPELSCRGVKGSESPAPFAHHPRGTRGANTPPPRGPTGIGQADPEERRVIFCGAQEQSVRARQLWSLCRPVATTR
jgi:hypothetical protein